MELHIYFRIMLISRQWFLAYVFPDVNKPALQTTPPLPT